MAREMTRTLKGFRDFLPADKSARDAVERTVVEVFERFGFQPVETPTLEYAELLLGKYGGDADRLVYTFEDKGGRQVALPYDQTVPTARVLSQYRSELPRYFRRYAIGNVFRAENPQKGRYREFRQCDIDIFGTTSPLADAEILACTWCAFSAIGFREATIRLNDRRLLVGTLQPFATETVDVVSIIRTVDKLDKVGEEGVVDELAKKGLDAGRATAAVATLRATPASDAVSEVLDAAVALGVPRESIVYTPELARGLDYYTGSIFEVALPGARGSLAGGGRYDTLIHDLGGPDVPAVGIAFGFDRVVEAAVSAELVPAAAPAAEVLVALFDEATTPAALRVASTLRAAGVRCELYPAPEKLGRQFKLADAKGIPLVAVTGPDEAAAGTVALRDLRSGTQDTVPLDGLVDAVRGR